MRIMHGHLRINFDMKFNESNMTGFARSQLVNATDSLIISDYITDITLLFRWKLDIHQIADGVNC